MIGKAICPASCGEIVQGFVDGHDFLITCPIELYSQVTIRLNPLGENPYKVKDNIKAYTAAKKTLEYFGVEKCEIDMTINSQIPRGIGLSSSTADITASCLAVASALGKRISPDAIGDIALSIEPSDGIMYSGAWIFDHIRGLLREKLGPLPEMDVYIVDTGEKVDTQIFNDISGLKRMNLKKQSKVREALDFVYKAFKQKDIKLLGDAMIKSALAHQPIIYKPHLTDLIDLYREYNLLGINIAHSGSSIGIFSKKGRAFPKTFWDKVQYIMKRHHKKYRIIKTQIDNKGPKIIREKAFFSQERNTWI